MGTFDLLAARAARTETLGKRTVAVGEREFDLLPEFPVHVAELWDEGKFDEGNDILFGGRWAEFLSSDGVTFPDIGELIAWLRQEYGLAGQGESKASDASSPPTSKRSRRTSEPSTGSA